MSSHKYFDRICCAVTAAVLVITVLFMNAESFGLKRASTVLGYENTLFNTEAVHSIEIVMDGWDDFIADCTDEEYRNCTVIIDNEAYKNVGIRAKGNTSLTQVAAYGNDRYSFKIEFDKYDSSKTYHGLDKLCLNNIIQDNTYMKDYLCYTLMRKADVAAPLCSYAYITVNGEEWGLYLAVEAVEESFLLRNYGKNYGDLYKPDTTDMGGGRGNGKNFDAEQQESADTEALSLGDGEQQPGSSLESNGFKEDRTSGTLRGSDDLLLKYIDDDLESYGNIFDNAKTDITDSDKRRLISALKTLSDTNGAANAVSVEDVIAYFCVHNFVLNFDSYTGSMIHNYYLYEQNGSLYMIPWDYNLAFGGFESSVSAESAVNYPIDTPVSGGSVEDRPMLAWIFADSDYTEMYHSCFEKFISDCFDSGYFSELFGSTVALISEYVEKDPTAFCDYDVFLKGTETLEKFCLLRAESVKKQLNGEIGSEAGTQIVETLVSAEGLSLSDMGSMGNMIGNGNKEFGRDFSDIGSDKNFRETFDTQGGFGISDGAQKNDTNGRENFDGAMPNEPFGDRDIGNFGAENGEGNADGFGFAKPDKGDIGSVPDGQVPDRRDDTVGNGVTDKDTVETNRTTGTTVLLGVSVAVLAMGMLFAFKFRRYR